MLHTTLTVRVQQNEASLGIPIALSANCPDKDKEDHSECFTLIIRLYVFSMNKNRYLRIGVLSNATNSMSKMACNEVQVMGFLLCALVIVVLAALGRSMKTSGCFLHYELNTN